MNRVFIVAEIGINHNGDIEQALQMIDVAKKTGFDAVKFQKRNADLYPERPYNSPLFGKTTYRDHKYQLEFNEQDYLTIDMYCKQIGIEWFASCFDRDSIEFIAEFKPKYWKIPSPAIFDLDLVKCFAKQDGKVYMSTGMSEWYEVVNAIKAFEASRGVEFSELGSHLGIVHCCSEYPCPAEHINLNMIKHYKELYPTLDIGYSSHDAGVPFSVCAVAIGATYIEVHITLDRTMKGSDHIASLEYRGMETLVRHIRAVEQALGVSHKTFYDGERVIRDKVQQVSLKPDWKCD